MQYDSFQEKFYILDRNEATEDDIHQGMICEVCEMTPIQGLRYNCIDCPTFDLCEECYKKEAHGDHRMQRKTTAGKL